MNESYTAHCICPTVDVSISGEPAVMAYCHCDSCRLWLGAPKHAARLWPTKNVNVTEGEAQLAVYERIVGSVSNLVFNPSIQVNYAESVMPMKDGLQKFADMPDQEEDRALIEA